MHKNYIEELKKDHNWLILLTFLILIGIKLYYFSLTYNQPLWWDEADYMNQARAWAFGSPSWEMDIVRPIFFSFILSGLFKIGLEELSIRLLELILGILAMFYFYRLVRDMYNKYIAIAAAFMF